MLEIEGKLRKINNYGGQQESRLKVWYKYFLSKEVLIHSLCFRNKEAVCLTDKINKAHPN
jgi:hypothetical protein